MDKKLSVFSVFLILILVAGFAYYKIPAVQELIATYTQEDFNEENIYSDMESISKRLDEEILKGSDSFTIYLKDMKVDEINQINTSLDGVFGTGSTYQQVGTIGNVYKKVTITIEKSTNYYALAAYKNHIEIPESQPKARALYEAIYSIIDETIREDMTDYEKEIALHDYLVENCIHSENTKQSAESDIYRAYGALVDKDAVCNGYAEALQLLFTCVGISSEFVIGTANGIDHAWNLVNIDGNWYHLDATWDDPTPDQGNIALHPYFNVSDDIIAKTHTWNREEYPKTTSMDYNYYVKNNAYFRNFDEYKSSAYNAMIYGSNNWYEAVIENYVEDEDEMQFIFEKNYKYNSISWQTFDDGTYNVLVLKAE